MAGSWHDRIRLHECVKRPFVDGLNLPTLEKAYAHPNNGIHAVIDRLSQEEAGDDSLLSVEMRY
jgi:hypothetical protein